MGRLVVHDMEIAVVHYLRRRKDVNVGDLVVEPGGGNDLWVRVVNAVHLGRLQHTSAWIPWAQGRRRIRGKVRVPVRRQDDDAPLSR